MPKAIKEDELILRARETFNHDLQAFEDPYNDMIDDLKFGNGGQWPDAIRIQRESDDRPCLRINKMPQFADRVMGDMRQSKPSIKIRPVDDKGDPETADIMTGLIRNIEAQSDADIVYDSGGEAMVKCGYGAWRVITDYISDDSFDQEILIERIKNQFGVLFDPAAKKWDRSDGRHLFIYEDMPKSVFERRYPGKDIAPWSGGKNDLAQWMTEDTIRVAEYFERDIETHKLYLIMIDGEQTPRAVKKDGLPPDGAPYTVLKERDVESSKITWYRISGTQILEGPIELKGKYIPVIPCYGKETVIEGKSYYNGIIRHAKDSQRLYNYYRSMDAETIALAPKAPWIMTAKMLGSHKNMWRDANKRNYSYLIYDVDPTAPGAKPERNIPQLSNQAIMQNIMIADQELHDTTGLQLASLGKKSNEQSGKAIEARAREGDTMQFTYNDNLVRAIKHTARVIVDLIPYVYDTARVARILGEDGTAKAVPVNQPFTDEQDQQQKLFDLTTGKYDVVVSVGPSYQTQRQESLAAMLDFFKILDPPQRAVIADQIPATSDWHNSDKITARLKKTIPPEMLADDEDQKKEPPKEPNPEELKARAFMEAKAEAEQEKLEVEITTSKANLKKAEAEAARAEAEAAIAEAKATQIAQGFASPESITANVNV
ncbi:MAG: portal protein [Gammaproteobacteria bacterium]